jgi:hypothetical protein
MSAKGRETKGIVNGAGGVAMFGLGDFEMSLQEFGGLSRSWWRVAEERKARKHLAKSRERIDEDRNKPVGKI